MRCGGAKRGWGTEGRSRHVLSLEHFLADAAAPLQRELQRDENFLYIPVDTLASDEPSPRSDSPAAGQEDIFPPVPPLPQPSPPQPDEAQVQTSSPSPSGLLGIRDCFREALEVGQPVMARYRDEWRLATVRSVVEDTVEVDWSCTLSVADVAPVPSPELQGLEAGKPGTGVEPKGEREAGSGNVQSVEITPVRRRWAARAGREPSSPFWEDSAAADEIDQAEARSPPYGLPPWCTVRHTFVEACSPEMLSSASTRCSSAPPTPEVVR